MWNVYCRETREDAHGPVVQTLARCSHPFCTSVKRVVRSLDKSGKQTMQTSVVGQHNHRVEATVDSNDDSDSRNTLDDDHDAHEWAKDLGVEESRSSRVVEQKQQNTNTEATSSLGGKRGRDKKSSDGSKPPKRARLYYNQWRKYGQGTKKVKHNTPLGEKQILTCYYKCNYPGCQAKKQIRKKVGANGEILEIEPADLGTHCHPQGMFLREACFDEEKVHCKAETYQGASEITKPFAVSADRQNPNNMLGQIGDMLNHQQYNPVDAAMHHSEQSVDKNMIPSSYAHLMQNQWFSELNKASQMQHPGEHVQHMMNPAGADTRGIIDDLTKNSMLAESGTGNTAAFLNMMHLGMQIGMAMRQ